MVDENSISCPTNADSVDWLEGWLFRKSHVINNSTDALENYQIRFIVHYGEGVDSDENIYCSSECESDFSDLRFTFSDGITQYDYWIQNYT